MCAGYLKHGIMSLVTDKPFTRTTTKLCMGAFWLGGGGGGGGGGEAGR